MNRQNRDVQQTGVMPNYGGGGEKCARCSKTVYLAEKRAAAGRVRIQIDSLIILANMYISIFIILLFLVISCKLF